LRRKNHQRLKVLGVTITEDDRLYFGCNHCHVTGPAVGVRDELPHYDYPNDTRKTRVNGEFAWEHRGSNGDWVNGSGGSIRKLYRIDEAIEAGGTVLVVEGEKDVDNLWTIGFAATCHPHGAGNWTEAHSAQLKGRTIVVLNDNDEVGYKYAAAVVKHSLGVARSVRRLDLKDYWPQIAAGEDVSDWLDHGGGSEEWLERIIAELPEINGEDQRQPPQPPIIDITDPTSWDGLPIPEQEWVVRDLIPAHQVCLFSGPGAAGKSTIGLHLTTAKGLGRMWLSFDCGLGADKALFIDAEDDLGVIHRRLAAVITHYNCTFADLNGNLHILSLANRNALLATAEKNGVVSPTELCKAILELAKQQQYRVIVIASVANVFAGNENDRSQVTQFIHLLKGLAIASNGSVILISHPSLTAIADKRGSSGSTAWLNSVRAQMHLDKAAENGADDTGLRKLEFKKNQYGAPAAAVTLTWHNGMFLPPPIPTDYERAAHEAKCDAALLKLVRTYRDRGIQLSQMEASTYYAPRKLADDLEAAPFTILDFKAAMARCLDNGTLVPKTTEGTPSKRRPCVDVP
jgi:RecA-family ATPase